MTERRCEWITDGSRCSRGAVVVMSIVTTNGGRRAERSVCSQHARRYARVLAPKVGAGVALLQYDFRHDRGAP